MNLMPFGSLGAVESNGAVTFGLWMPWLSAADGNVVTVKIIHEADQFLQASTVFRIFQVSRETFLIAVDGVKQRTVSIEFEI